MSLLRHRCFKTLLVSALLLGLLALVALRLAAGLLKTRIEQALGPRGEVKEISVGLGSVSIVGLRLPAPSDGKNETWPASDLLRAERVIVTPSLRDLLGARIVIATIRIEGVYVSMLRTREQKLKVLPGLADAPVSSSDNNTPPPDIHIGRIELVDGVIEFFDASIQRPALKLRLEQIAVRMDNLALPGLKGKSQLSVRGVLKGTKQDGKLEMDGEIEPASKDSRLSASLRGVDLLALRPYLLRASDTGIRQGSMDLDLHSTVAKGHLHAPGTLVLHKLELAGNGSFMGASQSAVVGMMKDKNGSISLRFSLDGDLNDPRFSLNEQLLGRLGAGLADSLGVSVEGLAKGVGSAGKSVVQGIGDGVGKLFGK